MLEKVPLVLKVLVSNIALTTRLAHMLLQFQTVAALYTQLALLYGRLAILERLTLLIAQFQGDDN